MPNHNELDVGIFLIRPLLDIHGKQMQVFDGCMLLVCVSHDTKRIVHT